MAKKKYYGSKMNGGRKRHDESVMPKDHSKYLANMPTEVVMTQWPDSPYAGKAAYPNGINALDEQMRQDMSKGYKKGYNTEPY
jgi:hypothetical protein